MGQPKPPTLQELEAAYLDAVQRREEAEALRREAAARLHEAEDAELRILDELEAARAAAQRAPPKAAARVRA
jgi:hypothetical protein